MAEEYFKVRKGLQVGENVTIDADTAGLTTTGDIVGLDLQLTGNDIKSSTGNTAVTLNDLDVTVAGDLQVTGNDIKSSTGDVAITLDGKDVSIGRFLTTRTVHVNQDETYSAGIGFPDSAAVLVSNYFTPNMGSKNLTSTMIVHSGRGTAAAPDPIGAGDQLFKFENLAYTGDWDGYTNYGPTINGNTGYSFAPPFYFINQSDPAVDTPSDLIQYGYSTLRGYWELNTFSDYDSNHSGFGTQMRTGWQFNGNDLTCVTKNDYFGNIDSYPRINAVDGGGGDHYYTFGPDGYLRLDEGLEATQNRINIKLPSGNRTYWEQPPGSAPTLGIENFKAAAQNDGPNFNFACYRSNDGINFTPTQQNDNIGQFKFNGNAYTGTNPGVPGSPAASVIAYATENWTTTANGSGFRFSAIPQGTTSNVVTIDSKPEQTTFTSNRTNFNNYISPNNSSIFNRVGDVNGSDYIDRITNVNVFQADSAGGEPAQINFQTANYDTGNNQYTPTTQNDKLGEFFFNGNYDTGPNTAVNAPAARFGAYATENWTSTANGGGFFIESLEAGTTNNIRTLDIAPAQTTFKSDLFEFEDSSANLLKGDKIDYRRTFGCWHKIANVTAAAANTVYEFDWTTDVTPHVATQGITVSNTSRLNFDTGGDYNVVIEMNAKNTDNADRTAYIWLAKNGTDISETAIKLVMTKDTSTMLAKDWLVEGIAANDYLEVRFAVDTTVSGISLEYVASQNSPYLRPAVPSATITITPVGA